MTTVKCYENCATRFENRGSHPPTRDYVDALIDGVKAAKVEAVWHSAVDPTGMPLFPSKIFPVCHSQASLKAFRYLIQELHAIHRPVLSWYPLNSGGGVLAKHPDWQMRGFPFDKKTADPKTDRSFACPNSPYGTLLPKFVAEVVSKVGFDGIWFDGSTFSCSRPGCSCTFCQKRFRRDTGRRLPKKEDFDNPDFRIWVNWRYDVLMDLWKRCVDAVKAVNPRAVVCFNNYRRRSSGYWQTGIPLRTLGWDALMSSELGGHPHQADMQIKINQAYQCRRGAETWWPLNDYGHCWVPDIEPLTPVQAALGCLGAGGVASAGSGVEPKLIKDALSAMQRAVKPRLPYIGGERVEYAAILVSQQTMDFYRPHVDATHQVWDGVHGANEFCRHAHLQSSVIFEDYLDRGGLDRYPVILCSNVACLSKKQAEQLKTFVRQGGILFADDEIGICDEMGYPHARPVLDDLLGIRKRTPGKGSPTLEIIVPGLRKAVGPYVTFLRRYHVLATPTDDVRLLANVVDRETHTWDDVNGKGEKAPRYPGLWMRRVGKGAVIYTGVNVFVTYVECTVPRLTRLWRTLLTRLHQPPVTLQGPICVTVNTHRLPNGQYAVHLHNSPGTLYNYPWPSFSTPGEVLPIYDLVLDVNIGRVRFARSALTKKPYKTVAGRHVHIPKLELHEVILLECEPISSSRT